MKDSIIQNKKQCYFCGRQFNLERHHILGGVANRKLSNHYGLWVWLCHDCHTGTEGAQYNQHKNLELKAEAQLAFERLYSHDEWMAVFRKNYI